MPPPQTPKPGLSDRYFEEELSIDYVNHAHMKAFSEALQADDNSLVPDPIPSPTHSSRPSTPALSSHHHHPARIRKVSALSDFAPVNVKVKKRRRGADRGVERKQEWLYLLVRWPLLFFIFLFIACEFGFYVIIRQMVNAKEWLSAWRGRKGLLRARLRAAKSYEEWKDSAAVLDDYLKFNEWKRIDEDVYYDWRLVRKVKRSLKTLREKGDARGVLGVLETCMRTNFAGVESARLYSETYYGTKDLIESYFSEQELSLEFIRKSSVLSIEEKKRFWKSVNTNLGLTALCLSGGASFGYYHFGVVKAFLDAGLLPRVITGTSAGGLVAALVCTRTDEELKLLLRPELAHKISACSEPFKVWFNRFLKTGARFDSVQWASKACFFTRGSMTFREAYIRTGRVLNVSVIPADRHSPTKLLNYITAPDTIIWTALLASAAVPGILNPVVLMQKLKDGRVVPWSWGSKFKDGSLRVDIPVQALNLYFNVTHPVVSQVNPHVHLFFFAPRGSAGKPVAHRKGKGWRGNFLLSAAEQWLKLELTKNFKLIRDLELLPQLLGQDWSSVFLQKFEGAVTIWPRTRIMDWFRILSDPDPPELARMLQVGQVVTWPKLHMIENRLRLERQIYLGRQEVRRAQQGRIKNPTPLPPLTNGQSRHNPIDVESAVPTPTNPEMPLSLDTDAESAFANGTHWFYKRGHAPSPGTSGTSTAKEDTAQSRNQSPNSRRDPLRSPVTRRKWAAEVVHTESGDADGYEDEDSGNGATDDVSTSPPKAGSSHARARTEPGGSFFHRLRTQSITSLTVPSPFASLRRKSGSVHTVTPTAEQTFAFNADPSWSTDSSSGDDLSLEEQRHIHHPSAVYPPNDWPSVGGQDGESPGDDDAF